MKNFCLLYFRFHAIQKNRLLICGVWKKGTQGESHLEAKLDETPLPIDIENKRMLLDPHARIQREREVEQTFCWVQLPGDYHAHQTFYFYERKGTKTYKLLAVKAGKLCALRKKIPMQIDEITAGESGVAVRGWGIAEETFEIRVGTKSQGWVKTKQIRYKRADVESAYPECKRDWIRGFLLETKEPLKGRLKIAAVCDGKREAVTRYYFNLWIWKLGQSTVGLRRKMWMYLRCFGVKRMIGRGLKRLAGRGDEDYERFCQKYMPGKRQLDAQRKARYHYEPEFSIVVPLYRTPEKYLDALIRSIQAQTYGKWKLFLSDGSGADSPLREWLLAYAGNDERIRVLFHERRLGITENTNKALAAADGDFVVFADHDDVLAPDALYECVKVLDQQPDTDVIYTDEDKMTADGKHYLQPNFKPDFNLDFLRSANYICHLFIVRRTLARKVGYLDQTYEGSQDYDYILRCVEQTERIVHIPKVLYHWRMHPGSVAKNPESKIYAYEAGRRAILAHYRRTGVSAAVRFLSPGYYESVYRMEREPLVSIIVPGDGSRKCLERCLASVRRYSDYGNYEICLVGNAGESSERWADYRALEADYPKVRLLCRDGSSREAELLNFAAREAKGEYLLFLRPEIWMSEDCSLRQMTAYCMRPDAAVVGSKILYPDDTVFHAGMVVGLNGLAGNAFMGLPAKDPGYFCRTTCVQDYSAVTSECMMVRRSVYCEAGGMDVELPFVLSAVDLCLRVGEKGYRVLYQPASVWYKEKSANRGRGRAREEKGDLSGQTYFRQRWKEILEQGDPCYNPNLTLKEYDFSLKE